LSAWKRPLTRLPSLRSEIDLSRKRGEVKLRAAANLALAQWQSDDDADKSINARAAIAPAHDPAKCEWFADKIMRQIDKWGRKPWPSATDS
jgi:hypothetical protein